MVVVWVVPRYDDSPDWLPLFCNRIVLSIRALRARCVFFAEAEDDSWI
jgi:hypothetical protein